ncbi:hypothetical protein SAMN05443575_2706 [Jatrophihabitans endophyticus]|uniref:N-acetyltransferase domain-containing protein n=1 Tax=Jatrophihabitans endophyticus TaxID=1206085 RepID=A0A1M5MG04_9ACTN|nr:DUF4081 domain-containing GNAT family N-acetyltransferase [Jatrophihabitans endophyticus]SHG75633.1 hypothetical protein SAMN05443575_2706 [Jatrophihabitans endophyticus]
MSSLLRRSAGTGGASSGSEDLTVTVLGDADRPALTRLVGQDPFVNAVLAARLDALSSLSPRRFGGTLLGVRDPGGRLVAAAFHGGNLLPVAGDSDCTDEFGTAGVPDARDSCAEAWAVLGRYLARETRVCSSIVGRASAVSALWDELAPSWGRPRAIRDRQPLLALHDAATLPPGDETVRRVQPAQLDAYVPAAAEMFTEELGVSPYQCAAAGDYRRRVASLVREGRAFAVFDRDGRVAFKADLGAVSRQTCQVQGVWVRPELRGRGLGTRALAGVLAHALTTAPTVSLYVNDFNVAARRMYARLGMVPAATLSTVLF